MPQAQQLQTTVASKIPAPTPEKLAAWKHVRNVWLAMKKNPWVSPELLDAEWEAKQVD